MTELLTSAQMRAVEMAAIDSGHVTGLTLMERAGQGVVDAILAQWPALAEAPHRAVVLCGPGNNGGDGFVVARLLREAGWSVTVYLHGTAEKLPPDARSACDAWCAMGGLHLLPDTPPGSAPLLPGFDPQPDLWVDAFFGIGVNRPLPEPVTLMMHHVQASQLSRTAPIVAVDIPSGLSADTGQSVQAFYLTADLTVTFHTLKPGHVMADGPSRCGRVVVADIGL